MRLITHNMLKCNAKGVEKGYPLIVEPIRVEVIESDFNAEMIVSLLRKIDFVALKSAALNVLYTELEPIEIVTDELKESEEFLRKVHHALFEIHVHEGSLICPESGRRFPIKDGIPNMLLHEDEV